jgi:hypothetical protein
VHCCVDVEGIMSRAASYILSGFANSFVVGGSVVTTREREWNRVRQTLTLGFPRHLIDSGEVCVWLQEIQSGRGSSS